MTHKSCFFVTHKSQCYHETTAGPVHLQALLNIKQFSRTVIIVLGSKQENNEKSADENNVNSEEWKCQRQQSTDVFNEFHCHLMYAAPIEQIIQHKIAAYINSTRKMSQFEFMNFNSKADCLCNQVTFFSLKLILQLYQLMVVLN